MMRRSWQLSLLLLYLPLWLVAFVPIAAFALLGGSGSFFDFDVLHWSPGLWLFASALIIPPIIFAWAAVSLIADFVRKINA